MKAEDIRLGQKVYFSHEVDNIESAEVIGLKKPNSGVVIVTIRRDKDEGEFFVDTGLEIGDATFLNLTQTKGYSIGNTCSFSFNALKKIMIDNLNRAKEDMLKRNEEYVANLMKLEEDKV